MFRRNSYCLSNLITIFFICLKLSIHTMNDKRNSDDTFEENNHSHMINNKLVHIVRHKKGERPLRVNSNNAENS